MVHGVEHLVRIVQVHRQHAQGVADEIGREVIVHNARILLENRAFLRLLDVALDHQDALGLDHLGDREEQAEHVLEVLLLPLRPGKNLLEAAGEDLQGFAGRIADDREPPVAPPPDDCHHSVGSGFATDARR